MITECPEPQEVADFHFLQLRTLKLSKENKNFPEYVGNILSAASKYGLLFIGTEGGFKVIKLETVLTIDEDKDNRSSVSDYAFDFVPSGTPVVLSLNSSQTVLAVCVKCATNVVINLYNLSNYSGSGSTWQPFCTNALSPPKAEVRDFVWNPAVEGWYAVCFSDGSLQVHEVAGLSVKAIGVLQNANAVAVGWSPKGKQLVVGKDNGSFTQYKPNLSEVRTIPAPALEESPVSVTSICWIANTVFAVLYVVGDCPNLFIVSAPKESVTYTNYYDICLGNNCAPLQKYLMHLEPSWGTLVCASLDSIEIAVLGNMPNWVQWDLREDGKALLPGKDGATHAIGMTVIYSAQRQLVINESESYPPMPVLFLLTNNGLLVSFHMINANPAAPSLVSTPLPLENVSSAGSGEPAAGPSSAVFSPAPSTSNQPPMSTTFIVGGNASGDQSPAQLNKATPNMNSTQTFGRIEVPSAPTTAEPKESPSLFGDGIHMKKPVDNSFNQVHRTAVSSHMPPTLNATLSNVERPSEVQSRSQDSYNHAIMTEIQSFARELQELKQLQISIPKIDSEDEMLSLKNSLNLQNYQKKTLETMQSLNSDIYTLKNVLLESFVMVEEACSRERRRNDHSYITLLKERALDPITAKRMQKMNQHYQYLSTQLQEVSDKLDQNWISLCSNRKKTLKNNMCISSTEAIYKTIVNNRNIIHNLKKKVDILMKKSEERKLRNTMKSTSWGRYHKRSTQEDLSKLADEFLQVKIDKPEEGEVVLTKKLPAKSQIILKEFLKQSSVVTVRPTAVYSPSQSRLLSNAIPSEDLDQNNEKDVSSKQTSTLAYEKEVPQSISSGEAQTPKATSNLSHSFERTPTQSVPAAPIYEPITPPEVINAAVPLNKSPSGTNMNEISSANGKLPDQSLIKGAGSFKSPLINNTEQGIGSSVSSNIKSPFTVSTSLGEKPIAFNLSVNTPSETSSFSFPKTLSFSAPDNKNITEISKLPTASANTIVSSASSFQFSNTFGLNKDASFSVIPNNNYAVITPKISAQIESKTTSETPKISLEPVSSSANAFNQSGNQTTTFNLPVTKASQVSSSFFVVPENKTIFSVPENKTAFSTPEIKSVFSVHENKSGFSAPENKTVFSVPENKTVFSVPENKTVFSVSGNKDPSLPKSNIEFSFQKVSDVTTKPAVTILSKDPVSESSSVAAPGEISFLNQTQNKTISVDTKSPTSSTFEVRLADLENSATAESATVTPIKISSPIAQKIDNAVTTTNQPATTNTFSDFTSLKQSISSSETPTTEPTPISVAVSSPSVNEAVQSAVLDLTSSSDAAKPLSSSHATAQPGIANSKPPSPPAPVLTPTVTTAAPAVTLFGQNPTVSSVVNSDVTTGSEVTPTKTESTPSVFGAKPVAPVFGQSTPERPSFFGGTSVFGQTPTTQPTSPFGQSASNSSFSPATGGFFSQMNAFGSPTSATSTVTTSSSDFNNQASTFSFGKPAFGQTTGSFGLAKTFFGQNAAPVTQATSPSSFSFGQNSPGMGSFFSGLGGKPSEENASKNVFGLSTAKPSTDNSNLFRNSSVTSFGAVNNSSFTSPGSFSSGGGSVAQAGFGSFQQNASPQPAGFASPAFGGAPTFGSSPAFGASPSFGSGNALASVFGQQQQVSSNFSNFANASSPTFGSLASQSPPSFGNSTQMGGGGFGSQGGGGFGASPVFGGGSSFGQSASFGSPSSPPSNSSAFTQWRS